MEYIKKEELIIGEIYKADNGSLTYIMKATKDLENVKNIPKYCDFMKHGCFNRSYLTFTNATSEEKHWLNTCIKLDKFITFEEAMKTFIPEYVECTNPQNWITTIKENNGNLIFKNDFKSKCHTQIKDLNLLTTSQFKPSTKEAYDAQFVVKEEEFMLPKKWCLKITKENLDFCKSLENNELKFNKNYAYCIGGYYSPIPNKDCNGFINIPKNYTEITFEQFKKYVLKEEIVVEEVIEPLPQFKVIETIETITKVENNEGNQFFIGDTVKSELNIIYKIESFKYNVDKTGILAMTDKNIRININRVEHYIEPKIVEPEFILPEKWCIRQNKNEINDWLNKNRQTSFYTNTNGYQLIHFPAINDSHLYNNIENGYTEITFDQFQKYVLKTEVKEETLLEKAKKLYPIGTKVNNYNLKKACIFTINSDNFYENSDRNILVRCQGNLSYTVYSDNQWAEIIK